MGSHRGLVRVALPFPVAPSRALTSKDKIRREAQIIGNSVQCGEGGGSGEGFPPYRNVRLTCVFC